MLLVYKCDVAFLKALHIPAYSVVAQLNSSLEHDHNYVTCYVHVHRHKYKTFLQSMSVLLNIDYNRLYGSALSCGLH